VLNQDVDMKLGLVLNQDVDMKLGLGMLGLRLRLVPPVINLGSFETSPDF
jgi:hypothetical protein